MKFFKNLFKSTTDVVDSSAKAIVKTANAVDYYANIIKMDALQASMEKEDELVEIYGSTDNLIARVQQHKAFNDLI